MSVPLSREFGERVIRLGVHLHSSGQNPQHYDSRCCTSQRCDSERDEGERKLPRVKEVSQEATTGGRLARRVISCVTKSNMVSRQAGVHLC